MKIDRKAIKQMAREKIRAARPRPALITLGYSAIVYVLSFAVTATTTFAVPSTMEDFARTGGTAAFMSLFLSVLLALFTGVMSFGYTAYTLRVSRGEGAGFSDVLSGFAHTGPVILMSLILFGFSLVWCIAILVPAILAMGAIIGMSLLQSPQAATVGMVVAFVLYFAAIMLLVYVLIRYALSTLALADHPEEGAMAAVRRSRTLLRGRYMELFVLHLSFIGWYLLLFAIILAVALVSVFVLRARYGMMGSYMVAMVVTYLAMIPFSCWLTPYISVTLAEYYRALSPEAETLPQLDTDRPEPF